MLSELPQIFKLIAALVLVLGLMGGLSLILRKLGLSGVPLAENQGRKKRLKLIESMPLDARRRLVLVQRDDVQHLIVMSAQGETVVESNIKPKNDKK